MADNVNHPSHYETGKFECIEVMQEAIGKEEVKSFCLCNAFKYLYRTKRKNGLEDVEKAVWYLNKYIELEKHRDMIDYFESQASLNRECNSYTDSEIRFKQTIVEHDRKVRSNTIDDIINLAMDEIDFVDHAEEERFITFLNNMKE